MDSNLMTDGVISLDDRPAIAAINRTNAGLDDHEKRVKTILDRSGREWKVYGDSVVRVTDASKNSLERLIKTMEQQAAVAGKSGVEKLIAQRDILIKKWGDEERAVQAITKAYDKMISAEQSGGMRGFGQSVQNFMQAPLQSAQTAVTGLLEKLGPMGSALAAGAAALVGIALAGFEAAKSLGEYGIQIKDVELRTGLSAREVGQFGFAARAAGQDVSIFERMMRGLSQAADDTSKDGEKARATMQKMGFTMYDATGAMKPTSQIMQEIAGHLAAMPNAFERDAAAIALFKRAGIEAIPVITELSENLKIAKERGYGPSEDEVTRFKGYAREAAEIEMSWERMKRNLQVPLVATVNFLFNGLAWVDFIASMPGKLLMGKLFNGTPTAADTEMAATGGWGYGATMSRSGHAAEIRSIHTNDAMVAAARVPDSANKELELAEKKLTDLQGQLKTGVFPSVNEPVLGQIAAQKGVVASLKAAAEWAKEFNTQLNEAVKRFMDLQEKATGKMLSGADRLLPYGSNWGSEIASGLQVKPGTLVEQLLYSGRAGRAMDSATNLDQANAWAIGRVGKLIPIAQSIDTINLDAQKAAIVRQSSQAEKMVGLSGASGEAAIRATYQIRIDLANQLAVIEANRIAKETDAGKRIEETARARNDYQKQMDEAHEEALLKQLELQKQQMDTLKRDAEGLWHTLLTKPENFGKQLTSAIHEALLKPITEGMAGITAKVLHPVIYGADGGGGIAGAFKSVFGGGKADPMKMSTDANTAVTAQNSVAVATLTAILSGAMGMAAPAVAAPAGVGGISLPSISAPAVSGPSISTVTGGLAQGGGGVGYAMGSRARGTNPLAIILGGGSTSAATPPFFGGATATGGTGGQGGGYGLGGMLGGLKNIKLGGLTRGPFTWAQDDDGTYSERDAGKITGADGLLGAGLMTGGTMLAQQGLLGSSRGTWGGVAMGTAGGAAIGFEMGGPLGAAIGAAAGLGIGIGEKLAGVETPQNEAKRLVKQLYGVSIDTAMANQIVSIAQQKYSSHVSIAVRDPDVRKMLELYAQGTGQKMPLSATTPQAGILAESGGRLYQQASYVNGAAYTYQSNLPVLGGLSSGTYPPPGGPNTSAGMGPVNLSLNIEGADTASFLTGQVVTPSYVADASMAAQNASYGRVQQAANSQVPGLVTGT